MNVAYLLEDTHLAGGTRVAVAQADALIARGYRVTLITSGAALTWRKSHAEWRFAESTGAIDVTPFDFVVGTFWRTLRRAFDLAGERTVHLCQGYEGSFTIYRDVKEQIDAAYRLPIPKITVSPHLVKICRRFYDDATCVGQIVDEEFYQPHARRPGERRRVLLVGPAQADFKGIDVGYAAVQHARSRGAEFDLVRVSQWPPADDEPAELAAEFHVGLDTRAMVRLIASCDIFLGPSREQEGFGLPAAEALASGVPAVLSEISSFRSWDPAHDYALFAAEGDAASMGDALTHLLDDEPLRARLVERGREVVGQFRAERTGARLEQFFGQRLR